MLIVIGDKFRARTDSIGVCGYASAVDREEIRSTKRAIVRSAAFASLTCRITRLARIAIAEAPVGTSSP